MTVAELHDLLKRDMVECADMEVVIELKSPQGQIVQAVFFADRIVERRDTGARYVLRMGWPS